ncbi:MAG: hypothetical protein ABEH40_00450 [Haloferacaceae archaeon]
MAEFDTPECAEGHDPETMSFVEAHDPMDDASGVDEESDEWRKRWRYSCPECGRVVEVRETIDGGVEEETIRERRESRGDPTSLSPVADWD